MLGTLQAKIGAAYLFHWLRGWFKDADENKRLLAETHWRTALRVLDSMSYLRGAVDEGRANAGQFSRHRAARVRRHARSTSLRRAADALVAAARVVHNELGDDAENRFASFERQAFAAASLGQVHRARLQAGDEVVVKIQYPGIARTIRDDIRNLLLFLLPARLSRDWDNTKEQFDDLRMRLERETDYVQEAATLKRARALFTEDDGIVVPRVFPEHSTARVLTMERLEGVHLEEFLATNPSQELRNEFARKLLHAWYRLLFPAGCCMSTCIRVIICSWTTAGWASSTSA